MIDVVTTVATIIGVLILFVFVIVMLAFMAVAIIIGIDMYREDMQQEHREEYEKD